MTSGESNYLAESYYSTNGDKGDPIPGVPSGIDVLDEYLSPTNESITEPKRSQYIEELRQVEEEIQTLRQVLTAKYRRQHFLKHQLGITVMGELRSGVHKGMDNLRNTEAYQKTTAAVKSAKEKTTAALNERWNILKQTSAFKSFEDKLGSAYSTVRWPTPVSQLTLTGPSFLGKLVRSATIGGPPEEPHSFESVSFQSNRQSRHFQDGTTEAATMDSRSAAGLVSTKPHVDNSNNNNVSTTKSGLQMAPLDFEEIDSDETEEFVQATESKTLQPQFTD